MEPVYSEWKFVVDADNRRKVHKCPYCDDFYAYLMMRYVTDREGETEKQFRVECPICKHAGKTYLHESIAIRSWEVRENDPIPLPPKKKRRW